VRHSPRSAAPVPIIQVDDREDAADDAAQENKNGAVRGVALFGSETVTTRTAMSRVLLATVLLLTAAPLVRAQPGVLTPQQLIAYTPDWKGDRFPDGRPKVPDAILDRMKSVTLEEASAAPASRINTTTTGCRFTRRRCSSAAH
jgi:hypothetical protein